MSDKVTHVEIRHRASDIDSAEHLLLQRQLRWVGHVIRMSSNRLPRRIHYGELVNGQRLPGCPKLQYMDHIRRILNKCNISCRNGTAFNRPRHIPWWVSCYLQCSRSLRYLPGHSTLSRTVCLQSPETSKPGNEVTSPQCNSMRQEAGSDVTYGRPFHASDGRKSRLQTWRGLIRMRRRTARTSRHTRRISIAQ